MCNCGCAQPTPSSQILDLHLVQTPFEKATESGQHVNSLSETPSNTVAGRARARRVFVEIPSPPVCGDPAALLVPSGAGASSQNKPCVHPVLFWNARTNNSTMAKQNSPGWPPHGQGSGWSPRGLPASTRATPGKREVPASTARVPWWRNGCLAW